MRGSEIVELLQCACPVAKWPTSHTSRS